MTTTIKPIETVAYGRRFRSRLEARYAVFLTTLGLRWEYEPEGFKLPSGWYLPDFCLPDVPDMNGHKGIWIEIKPWRAGACHWGCRGVDPHLDPWADARLREFEELHPGAFFISHGLPEPSGMWSDRFSEWNHPYITGDWDQPGILDSPRDPWFWCVCSCGKTAGAQYEGREERIECDCSANRRNPDVSVFAAAVAAHSARFEHGERHD